MRSAFFPTALALLLALITFSPAEGSYTVDPFGFAVSVEADDTLETAITLANDGEQDALYDIRLRSVNRDNRLGPRRDEPGETLFEIQMEYRYTVGLAWDAENSIMYACHTENGRIVGYLWDGEEIQDIVVDFETANIPAASPVGLAYFDGVLYTWYWGQLNLFRYDIEGNQLQTLQTQWGEGINYGSGVAVDPENALLYASAILPNGGPAHIQVYDINDNYAQVGRLVGFENIGENRNTDVRNRLNWVTEHEEGHLWIFQRDPAGDDGAGPYWPPYAAWQVDVIPTEEGDWEWELVTQFEVESDAWSNGIGHDGENLWIGNRDSDIVLIVDDGIVEPNWLTMDPMEGELPAGEEIEIAVTVIPTGLEPGPYDLIVRINIAGEDESTIEFAAVMSLDHPARNVLGTVIAAENDQAVESAKAALDYFIIERFTDGEGAYLFENIPIGEYQMTFTHPDFLSSIEDFAISEEDEEIELNVALLHAEATPDVDDIEEDIAPNQERHVHFNIANGGTGPLNYQVERQLAGGADADPWELRAAHLAGAALEDNRLEGVVFTGDRFYVTGHGGDPTIYILDRDGEPVGSMAQPGVDNGYMRDLAWDGALIWGSAGREVIGFDLDGEIGGQFQGPYNPTTAVAWDPDREVLWLAATTSDPVAYDRQGNEIEEFSRRGLRIYGLAYWPDDPDGYGLYIFNSPGQARQMLHKMNPMNGDTMVVRELFPEGGGSPLGAFITNRYDIYSWVLMTMANNGADDRIDIWQLDVRLDWFVLDPAEGEIAAGDSQEFDLLLNSEGLTPESYHGELVFTHTGRGDELRIPVTLNVIEGPVHTERTIRMHFGWNMVSVNLQPDEEDVRILTAPLVEADVLEMMKDGAGHFYRPEFDFNNIPGWFVEQGYQMKVTADAELTLEGMSVLSDEPIALVEGWQLISYYPRVPIDARVALSGIVDQLDIAKDGDGHFYVPRPFDFSNMGDMREGQGYQVKVSEDVELVYRGGEFNVGGLQSEPVYFNISGPGSENMSLLLINLPHWALEIAAFNRDGRLIGAGAVNAERQAGLAVWRDGVDGEAWIQQSESFELKVWDGSSTLGLSVEWVIGGSIFEADGLAIGKAVTTEAVPIEFALYAPYPNPFNSRATVRFDLPEAAPVSLTVFDGAGRVVDVMRNPRASAGSHEYTFDAGAEASGVYFFQLNSGRFNKIQKAVLIR